MISGRHLSRHDRVALGITSHLSEHDRLAFSDAPAVRGTITVTVPHNFSGDESALRADLAHRLEGVAGISRVAVERADAPPSPDDSRVTLTSQTTAPVSTKGAR